MTRGSIALMRRPFESQTCVTEPERSLPPPNHLSITCKIIKAEDLQEGLTLSCKVLSQIEMLWKSSKHHKTDDISPRRLAWGFALPLWLRGYRSRAGVAFGSLQFAFDERFVGDHLRPQLWSLRSFARVPPAAQRFRNFPASEPRLRNTGETRQ
jgi:hypothetical protein